MWVRIHMQLIASVSDKKRNNKAHFLKYCAKLLCIYIIQEISVSNRWVLNSYSRGKRFTDKFDKSQSLKELIWSCFYFKIYDWDWVQVLYLRSPSLLKNTDRTLGIRMYFLLPLLLVHQSPLSKKSSPLSKSLCMLRGGGKPKACISSFDKTVVFKVQGHRQLKLNLTPLKH